MTIKTVILSADAVHAWLIGGKDGKEINQWFVNNHQEYTPGILEISFWEIARTISRLYVDTPPSTHKMTIEHDFASLTRLRPFLIPNRYDGEYLSMIGGYMKKNNSKTFADAPLVAEFLYNKLMIMSLEQKKHIFPNAKIIPISSRFIVAEAVD